MKYAFAPVALSLGANALVVRQASQCVRLQASGGASGVLGQLGDGQNRIGGGNPIGCYCLSGDGAFTDSNGRGCILTPPTTQFQCDAGANPTAGFAIGSNGGVTHNGSGKFYACPVNDKGEYNVYSQPAPGQDKCVEISLGSAGSCGAGNAPQPSSPAQTQPAPQPSGGSGYPTGKPSALPAKPSSPSKPSAPAAKPSALVPAPEVSGPACPPAPENPNSNKPENPHGNKPSSPAGSNNGECPADLNGNYEYPHLIVPVDKENPDKAYGTSYNGKVDSHTCSIYNFDIPASMAGKKCTLNFLFPEQKDLETSSYTTSGHGKVDITKLKSSATEKTTYANKPAADHQVGSMEVTPGHSYNIYSGDCAAGQTVTYELCSEGDFSMEYFQDWNPSPIGMYVRQC